jgi:septum formation inhibitor-activating ATPase MinD
MEKKSSTDQKDNGRSVDPQKLMNAIVWELKNDFNIVVEPTPAGLEKGLKMWSSLGYPPFKGRK